MNEYRCKFCHKLLFKHNDISDFVEKNYIKVVNKKPLIEIKCSKCNKLNCWDLFYKGREVRILNN